nr:restriction endonuclease subunit S [uncultured Veillonella sp.]
MNKEKRRVPKLRFPGFTEDWEQRKFDEIMTFINGRAYKQDELLSDGKYKVLRVGNFYTNDSWYYSNLELDDKYYAMNGDLLYTWSATFGPHIWKGEKVIYHYHIWKIVLKNKIDKLFALQLLEVDKANIMSDKNGSTMVHITKQGMENKKTILPLSLNEQKQISKFLSSIDKLITLHQRKLEHLNLKKKALLQKLFPKNGERYPELRFPGFTDAWEQRKADYIFKSVTDKGYPELPVLSASQELGMVYREQNGIDIQHNKKNEASYKRVLPGQFVIHLRSFQGGFAYSEVEGITSPAYTVMSFKNSNEQYGLFWKHIFKSEIFIKRLETITYGIRDGRSISFSDFKSLILQYPSFSEQKMIGDSIAIIERGITLHQRKLEHLQLQKKALLQQMFV